MGIGFCAAEWIKFWDYVFECQFYIVNKIHVDFFSSESEFNGEESSLGWGGGIRPKVAVIYVCGDLIIRARLL